MVSTRRVFVVALASTLAGAALMFAYDSFTLRAHGSLAASAADALAASSSSSSASSSMTSAALAASNGTIVSGTGTASIASSTDNSSSITTRQFRLLFNVDLCTFNLLGKDGWQPIQYGQATDNNDYLQVSGGRDENCQSTRLTHTFIWVLFERDS